MVVFPEARIDYFISEDVPYLDLTSEVLGVADQAGEMEYYTREECVLAGTDVVRRIARNLGCEVVAVRFDGDRIAAGESFMTLRGPASALQHLRPSVGGRHQDPSNGGRRP